MKQVNSVQIAKFFNFSKPTIYTWKKQQPERYKAFKNYLFFKENDFFKELRDEMNKITALSILIKSECNSKYAEDLFIIINESKIKEIISLQEEEENEHHQK